MGNCFALCRPRRKSYSAPPATTGRNKVLRVVKNDGKILEYTRPMLVKDILMNFAGYEGIGLSDKPLRNLPTNYELKIGHVYYLLPLSSPVSTVTPASGSQHLFDADCANGIKRIRVIITKQQLQELLSKNLSVKEMLLGIQKETRWRPMLETIPEGK